MRQFLIAFIIFLSLILPAKAFAGGGLVEWLSPTGPNSLNAYGFVNPGDEVTIHARVASCKNCPIKIKLEDPQSDDAVNQLSDKTDGQGEVYAKIISRKPAVRSIYVEVTLYDGSIYPYSSREVINFAGKQLVWTPAGYKTQEEYNALPKIHVDAPQISITGSSRLTAKNTQRVVEFKVSKTQGDYTNIWTRAEGEEYQNNSGGATGNIAYAYVDPNKNYFFKAKVYKNMTESDLSSGVSDFGNEVYLAKMGSSTTGNEPSQPSVTAEPTISPTSSPSQVTVTEFKTNPETAQLKQKLEDLQKQLDDSRQQQAKTESRLNQIINWLKSFFPFFK